jgi:predicted cation transporter
MLIPGNIPNIIAAHALKIKSSEWARVGVPVGSVFMAFTALLLMLELV